ncbi:MAG: hypothetical protein L6R41_003815 [Letrouitia leprolyta]|nr:MAG: hypothetical protein L6R41_003815 [Letrouitia leprolyta]
MAAKTPPNDPVMSDAPPVAGAGVPEPPAGLAAEGEDPDPDPDGAGVVLAVPVDSDVDGVADTEAEVVATTLEWVALDIGAAAEVLVATADEDSAVVEAGAAVATQSHTALAAPWTARPVTGPQAETTQPRAAEAMAADWDELH